jgi:hypothetical protein
MMYLSVEHPMRIVSIGGRPWLVHGFELKPLIY